MKYINYLWHSKTRYAVHSPFLYKYINEVLRDKKKYNDYRIIENMRASLLKSHQRIVVNDLGAGSRKISQNKRKVSDIARFSLMKTRNAQLLYRMARKNNPHYILELGTSLGITTHYLAAGSNAKVITIEGSHEIKRIAEKNSGLLPWKNIEFIEGDFDEVLPHVLNKVPFFDFVLIDGNHRKEPVLRYFRLIMEKVNVDSILVIDDIHWSDEMEEAWEEIKKDERVRVTMDLFFMGIVFLKKELHKEHFVIRF